MFKNSEEIRLKLYELDGNLIQNWERERFKLPPLEKRGHREEINELRLTYSVNESYISKPWICYIGMLKLLKVGLILREGPKGNKDHFISCRGKNI